MSPFCPAAFRLPLWALLVVSLRAHAQDVPEGVLADRIVMVVGDRLITASDVALEEELVSRDPSPVVPLQAQRDDPLSFLRDLAIIRGLAGETSVYRPTPAEVRGRVDALRSSWPDPESWQRFLTEHGLDEERLSALLFSRMVAERYIQRNVGLAARSAGEDEAAYVARFETWMAAQRRRVSIRKLEPLGSVQP